MSDSEEEITKNLNHALIRRHLSDFSRNAEGTGFAYLKLELENRETENITEDLSAYQQLKFIHFTGNKISNISVLSKLPNILRLELANNKITTLEFFNNEETFLNLQYLDLSKNLIRNLTAIRLPKLIHLLLNNNEIINTDSFLGHPNLKILELRANKISYITGIKGMPKLEELYLSENNISSFESMEEMLSLKRLHLRKNSFNTFDEERLPELPEIIYLNFRENLIKDLNKVALLKKYGKLEKIVVSNNPCWTSQDLIREILIFMPRIVTVNKITIEDPDREVAYDLARERWNVAEAARKEAERKAQEAADKGDS
jgi:hypothetical protein